MCLYWVIILCFLRGRQADRRTIQSQSYIYSGWSYNNTFWAGFKPGSVEDCTRLNNINSVLDHSATTAGLCVERLDFHLKIFLINIQIKFEICSFSAWLPLWYEKWKWFCYSLHSISIAYFHVQTYWLSLLLQYPDATVRPISTLLTIGRTTFLEEATYLFLFLFCFTNFLHSNVLLKKY